MSEPVWYYAQGDNEKGPLTTAQIKALTAAGKIRRDDFVWKEGMESWAPARELTELFDPETISTSSKSDSRISAKRKASRPVSSASNASAADRSQPIGQLAIAIGLLMVLLARGCDSLSNRYVSRLDAISAASQHQFFQQWNSRRETLQQQLNSYADADQPEAQRVREQLETLNETMRAQAEQLRSGPWNDQLSDARIARDNNLRWGFWREATFQAGTLILAVGLLAFTFNNNGPERWICLAMLAAIVGGIYLSQASLDSSPETLSTRSAGPAP